MKEEPATRHSERGPGKYVAAASVMAAFAVFIARLKAYFRITNDVDAIKDNIARSEAAAAQIRSARSAKSSKAPAASVSRP